MSEGIFERHVARLKSSLSAHSPDTICDFITEHTYIRGQKFNFHGHEYQKEILQDKSQDIVIVKSAQLGISEMSARLALARAVLVNGFSSIYTLPSASAAQNFMKTRIDPVIDSSPYLSELVSKEVDNSAVKRFGDSYVYLRGAQVDRQAISIPADLLIVDEVNNSNQDVITLYESRLIHSAYAMTVKLSTPTIPNYGVDKLFRQSKRKFNLCQCDKCNEWFVPDYHEHVRIPGFTKDIREVSKSDFSDPKFLWMKAYVACPKCAAPVDMINAKRQWVIENPDDAFLSSGYQITPFECPTVIKPSALVKASVEYERPVDFFNQRLAKSLEDRETSLGLDELQQATINEKPGGGFSYVMGLDMGNTCWMTLAAVLPDNTLVITKVEAIPLHQVVSRAVEIAQQYRVRMLCVDRGPMTEAVYQIQQRLRNCFAAVFVPSKGIDLFKVIDRESNLDRGVADMRQVNIAKDACMDVLMGLLRAGKILKVSDENDKVWWHHLMDNKRVQMFKDGELVFTWVKTLKEDHLHMALVYALVASRILGVSVGNVSGLPLMTTFKYKPQQ